MYLCPGTIAGATEDCCTNFFLTRDGQYHTYVLDLSGKANWKGNLNAIRLDFFDGNSKAGDYVEISQFGFAKSAADANTLKAMYDQGQTHSWDNGVITVEPGYRTEGIKTYTCTHSGATKTESIPALGLKGDLNNDGIVDGADSVLLQQYIAEWTITINEAAADVNKDGDIDGKDVVLLLQHLAEWEIEF